MAVMYQTVLAMRPALPCVLLTSRSSLLYFCAGGSLTCVRELIEMVLAAETECTAISDPGPRNHSVLGRVHVGWLLFTAARDG